VLIDGIAVSAMSRNDRARLRRRSIGYVFQDFNLLAGLSAVENVCLPMELDGISARKARTVGMEALEELGLTDRASSFPDELSGGERQRVAIARAVVGERHRLLADEPSGAPGSSAPVSSTWQTSSARSRNSTEPNVDTTRSSGSRPRG
jgi:putative ABC transport system ATP-binding protein